MRFTILVLMILTLLTSAEAQWSASGSFLIGVPQGEFASNLGRNGYGGEITGAFAPPESPFRLGVCVGVMSYGSDERREPFSTTISSVTVLVTTNNNIYLISGEGRIQPNAGMFRPYLSGTFGATILDTRTSIDNASNGEEVASSTNHSDVAFNYGFGAGLDVRVWENTDREPSVNGEPQVNDVSVHIGGVYLRSGEAEYLKEGSIRSVNGTAVYDVQRSRTDLLLYSIGVSVTF